jgi:hypothetical protein
VLEFRSNMVGAAARLTWRGFTDLTADIESCVQLVLRARIIPIERSCGRCRREMYWKRDNSRMDGYKWRHKRPYRITVSLRIDSFFSSS